MKKIVVAAFAIAFTAVAQAAAISWSASAIAASPDLTVRSTYVAYLFEASTGFDTVTAALSAGDLSVLDSAVNTKQVGSTGGIIGAKWTTEKYSTGDVVSAFAVVLNATAPAEATYYMAIDTKNSGAISAAGAASVTFGSQASNPHGWAEIAPEPTSGLMMLLGMGVLALRRRRA